MAKVPAKGEGGVALRGTTGLPDNVEAKVEKVTFSTDSRYQSGKELCGITELVGRGGEKVDELLLSVGKGWEDSDKGRKMVRADGSEPGGINNSTMFQNVINKAMDAGAEEIITERFNQGIMPFHAELLEGLWFLWKREEYTPLGWADKSDEEKERGKPTRLVPFEYLGTDEGGGEKKAKKDKSKKDKKPATD